MHVDLVIVTYNSGAVVEECLDSIYRYTPEPKTVFIVDNGSSDETLAKAASFPDAVLLASGGNEGYSKAANRGIRAGAGELIAVMNADTKMTERWLEPLADCLNRDERAAVAGPKMINRHNQLVSVGTDWNWTMPHFMERNRPGLLEEERDCLVVNGACFLMKRSLLPVLGLLDERYFFYFEETDYCFNASYHGYRVVYCPQSVIYHAYEHDTESRNDAIKRHWEASRQVFESKWEYDCERKRAIRRHADG